MTPEQQSLLQKAISSLEAARVLLTNEFPEFAASRAYYAVFYVAEAFLEGEGFSFSKHSAVIAAFGQQFARTGRVPVDFHRNLITAEQIRRQGDYQSQGSVLPTQAQTLIDQAAEFITLMQQEIHIDSTILLIYLRDTSCLSQSNTASIAL